MTLILALNPGNSHSPTLARLARELQGYELIGAESSPVAIRAVRERVPDLVLLPAKQARGQADLMAHLKTIPGGVPTLKLPTVNDANPVEIARQIREMLEGGPAQTMTFSAVAPAPPLGASPQLIAGATAAINWIRARRARWEVPQAAPEAQPAYVTSASPETHAASAPYATKEPEYYEPIPLSDEPYETYEPREPDEPSEPEGSSLASLAAGAAGVGGSVVSWLPRIAALAVVIGIVGGVVSYWPRIRGAVSSTTSQSDRPAAPAESDAPAATPIAPPPAATPVDEPDPLAKVSGWVAVFAPFEITISEGGRGVQSDDRGRAMLTPGRHRLRFQNKELGYDETRAVDVKPADTTTVNLTPQTTLAVTSTEPAEVLVDGTRVGETPYEGKISLGTHTVTVKNASAERQLAVEATSRPVRLEVNFSKP